MSVTNEVIDNGAPPEELSLRGQIEKAIEETNAKHPVEPPAEETPEQKEQRARDEQGRFAKEEAKKRETLTLKKDAAQAAPVEPDATAAALPAVKAPESWSAPLKAKFSELPPDVQVEITRRESEMHRKFTEQDQDRNFGKQVRELSQPYMATIIQEGATPALTYQEFLKTAYALRTATPAQKTQMLLNLAAQFNVPLNLPQQGQFQPHPQLQSLEQQIAELKQERQAELQQRASQEAFSLKTEIEAFAGEPGHEHFETVKPVMAALLESGTAETLQDAYDQAVWARPDIRSTLTAHLSASAEEKRLADIKDKALKARQAAGSVTGGPGAGGELNGAGNSRSLRDELRANLRAATGRV